MTVKMPSTDAPELPYLVLKVDGQSSQVSLVEELTIGRADDNDLRLSDPKVSRHHAMIARQGRVFMLTDLGSANGTWVDGVRLACPHPLRHGQRITIGDTELTYREPGKPRDDTMVSPVPAAVKALAARTAAAQAAPGAGERRDGRGLMVGLVLAGCVLFLALLVVGLYAFAPDVVDKIGIGGRETAVPTAPVAQVGLTPAAPTAAPSDTPAAATATPETPPLSAEELNDQLAKAQVAVRRSKFEEAVGIYQDLATRVPQDARPHTGWAWALLLDAEPGQALEHAQRAVELDPASADAAVVLARAYLGAGDKEQALAQARKAVQLGPGNASALAALAEAYRLNDQYAEAVDQADLALVQDINNADAHRARAWLYYLVEGDLGRAVGELHVAAGLQTELWLRRHELGEMLIKAENYTTAIIAFQDALQLRPKAVTYSAIGDAYYRLEQYDQARASLQQAVTAGASDAQTLGLLALALARQTRCDDAETYVEQALAQDGQNAQALEARAVCQVAALTPTAEPTAVVEATPTPTPGAPRATRAPAVAAVSGQIAFPVWNGGSNNYDVYVARATGTGRRLVAEAVDQPALSPTGQWIAVRGRRSDMRNLFVMRIDGSSIKQVTQNIEDNLPYWSPDGNGLIYATTKDRPGHPKALYVIDPVPIQGRQIDPGRRLDSGPGPVQGEFPVWLPDGRLAYQGCDYTVNPQKCGLFTISPGGGPFTQLTFNGADTAPSGSGGRIAFMSNRDGNWEIYVVAGESGLKRLTNNASDDGLPVWSPDGKTIAFVSNQGGPWAIWAMNPDGSGRRKLFDIGGAGLMADWTTQRITWVP